MLLVEFPLHCTGLLLRSRFRSYWLPQRSRNSDPPLLRSRPIAPRGGGRSSVARFPCATSGGATIHFHNWGGGGGCLAQGASQLGGTLQLGGGGGLEQAALTPTTCWRSNSPRPLHKVGLWIAESSTVGLPWSFQLLLNGVQGHGLGSAHIGRDTRDTRHISHRAQKQEQNLDTHFDAQSTYIIYWCIAL